eukprot:CAMPEP_0113483198 /NCGR_PEP_ID=MMETSP0014_2-20120614/23310_1 /TAXON_ID=2857 /ORGANISM="Nitzschia sp." /LENGTH=214 /DNA_ID=CAMNT_0000376737 /DNA_START=1074 /DNA_END=1719 /DNA_ORIENTATION=+ /assembly_acc=CAM_ASM_000159
MIFLSFFKTLVGKEIAVELKNDVVMTGTLHSVDQYLNVKLLNVNIINPEKYPQLVPLKNCFIRGSVVRYIQIPPEHVDTELLQDAARKENAQRNKKNEKEESIRDNLNGGESNHQAAKKTGNKTKKSVLCAIISFNLIITTMSIWILLNLRQSSWMMIWKVFLTGEMSARRDIRNLTTGILFLLLCRHVVARGFSRPRSGLTRNERTTAMYARE